MRALLILLLLTMSPSFLQAQTLLNQTLNLDTGS
ncbi:MAG TPA: alpha/beta hydrolase, partial [Pseudomonas sp.]|nr:alpha/beta hydrolase [Pseudomonas sp.]